jgi:DNA polymerase IV
MATPADSGATTRAASRAASGVTAGIVVRAILHVDMDAFYASVEVLQNPALKGKPVIVGGDGSRGVVASCSYEARAFGVRSAMASGQAKRLCPQAIWIGGNHGLYGEYSARVHKCFHAVTPHVEGIALDEAFLDVSGAQRLLGPAEQIAADLREAIRSETGLHCSVGIAPSKLLAKLASKAAKPSLPGKPPKPIPVGAQRMSEGVVRVDPDAQVAFIQSHPIEALWGVGPATKARLERYGVRTVADLATLPEDTVIRAVGKVNGAHLHRLSLAIDDRPVESDRAVKSISHEETFSSDVRDLDALNIDIIRMADAVSNRMREASMLGRTITLKLKFPDFSMITRAKTVAGPTASGIRIAEVASALLRTSETVEQVTAAGVRLLGVGVSGLTSSESTAAGIGVGSEGGFEAGDGAQLDLFAMTEEVAPPAVPQATDAAFDQAIAAVREKFGDAALAPAALATAKGLRVKRRGDTQWGPSELGAATAE